MRHLLYPTADRGRSGDLEVSGPRKPSLAFACARGIVRCREPGHTQMTSLTAYVEQDPETQLYVAVVPGLPGAHSQAASLDELRANLEEVMGLLLEADDDGNAKTS